MAELAQNYRIQQYLIKESLNLEFLSEIVSVLLKCPSRPRLGVLYILPVIIGLDNTQDLNKINLKK